MYHATCAEICSHKLQNPPIDLVKVPWQPITWPPNYLNHTHTQNTRLNTKLLSPATFPAPIDADDNDYGGAAKEGLTSNDTDSEDNYLLKGGFQLL
jgi:hypothetical protein